MVARGLAAATSHGIGWTGGQYRLARALLGLSAAWHLAQAIDGGPGTAARATPLVAAIIAAVLAAAGVRARVMLGIVFAAVATFPGAETATPPWCVPLLLLLTAHLLVPTAPSGASAWPPPTSAVSFAWLVAWSTLAAPAPWWIGLAAGVILLAGPRTHFIHGGVAPRAARRPAGKARRPSMPGVFEGGATPPDGMHRRPNAGPIYEMGSRLAGVRPWAWAGLAALWTAGAVRGPAAADVFELQLLVFALDPAWIPPRWPSRADRVFYDGTCALCHGAVRFLLAEDRTAAAFTFGPLHGRTWRTAVPAEVRAQLPDSVIVQTADGRLHARAAAVTYLLERLGGVWRVLGTVLRLVPRPLGDAVYDAVARVRGRVFGRMPAECPLPADLRSRLVD